MVIAPLRYVVLHHTGWQKDHFDLLLETSADASLAGYRLSTWPPTIATHVSSSAPHRRIYLDYEGPISGGRGRVRRVAGGIYERVGETALLEILLLDSGLRVLLQADSVD